jgi:hypothetical protein
MEIIYFIGGIGLVAMLIGTVIDDNKIKKDIDDATK